MQNEDAGNFLIPLSCNIENWPVLVCKRLEGRDTKARIIKRGGI